MNTKMRMLSVWSGVAFFVLWGTGLALTGWIVPLTPSFDAQTVANIVQENQTRILLGAAFMTVFSSLYLPWTVVLSSFIKPIEAPSSILSKTQIVGGVMAQMTYFLPPFMWAVAAYRPLRNPEITQAFIDAGWLIFITGIGPFILQYAALGIAIFSDKRATPAFPRWAGYLQVWISISFVPAIMPFFMKTGPFAWNGIFVWWIPLTLFVVWFVAMIVLARKAVLRDV